MHLSVQIPSTTNPNAYSTEYTQFSLFEYPFLRTFTSELRVISKYSPDESLSLYFIIFIAFIFIIIIIITILQYVRNARKYEVTSVSSACN